MTPKPKLVMLGGALPQRSAPTAGAEYVTSLAEELSRIFDVRAVAPGYEANQAAIDDGRHVVASRLVGVGQQGPLRRLIGLAERAGRAIDLALPPLYFAGALCADAGLRRAIREADVIDLQWTEFVALAPLVRILNRDAAVLGTMHDCMTQVADRSSQESGARAILHRLRRHITARHEGRLSASVTSLQVLSDKDARLISALPGAGSSPHVIHPPRPVPRPHNGEPSRHQVLFVGAFGRLVNQDAVRWFLREVWPTIEHMQPDARLVLAGSDPQGAAAAAAAEHPRVEATGFVEDLGGCYGQASVVVVPLRDGGGVKFKTIDALLHGVPVVTTSVGAEGIEGHDLFWAITDDASGFAMAVVEAMRLPAARRRAEAAARQVAARYSRTVFASSVSRVYGGLTR